jgi:hypothetical protein
MCGDFRDIPTFEGAYRQCRCGDVLFVRRTVIRSDGRAI